MRSLISLGRIPHFKELRGGVYFVQEIPRSPSGKILRRRLKQSWDHSRTMTRSTSVRNLPLLVPTKPALTNSKAKYPICTNVNESKSRFIRTGTMNKTDISSITHTPNKKI